MSWSRRWRGLCAPRLVCGPGLAGLLPSGRRLPTGSPGERREALDERPQLVPTHRVVEGAVRAERGPGVRYEQGALAPERDPQGAQDREPGVLGEHGAEPVRAGAHERDRLADEDAQDVRRWPGQPVDGILEHARDRVDVLRRGEDEAVRGRDRVLEGRDRPGDALGRLQVAVVERDAADRRDRQLDVLRRQLRRGTQQRRVERTPAQTARDPDELRHDDPPLIWSTPLRLEDSGAGGLPAIVGEGGAPEVAHSTPEAYQEGTPIPLAKSADGDKCKLYNAIWLS